jgi:CubicO group peptidase (beta-lactamase class C family)
VATIHVEVDPGEVGFDAKRLTNITAHFAKYVDDGRLPGWLAVVSRRGKVAYVGSYGHRDREQQLPVENDTLFRIYSMTKPITSVALMMLYEEGAFELTDPVSRYIESFAHQRVFTGGSSNAPVTAPSAEPVRVWHLLTHTAGLTYGFHYSHPVDALYRAAGFDFGAPPSDLETSVNTWASLPLLFEPGTEWNYSVATDVVGRLVEVLSGKPLDRFLDERIFQPLGMADTGFFAPAHEQHRLAMLYAAGPRKKAIRAEVAARAATQSPVMLSGGGGLVSSAHDYHRFTQMLLNGGALDNARLLSPRTVAYMSRNHLPGGADLEQVGRPLFAETNYAGVGFGLGFSVVLDPAASKVLSSPGTYAWGGAASTGFWVDPVERITAVFLTQLLPSSTHPLRSQFSQLVQQALVD